MALCPGVTETNFFEAAHIDRPPMRAAQAPEDVVAAALRGLARRKSHVISGWTNLLMVESERFVPRSVVIRVAGKALRPKYGE
jgi:short-subunit dehydrogenase